MSTFSRIIILATVAIAAAVGQQKLDPRSTMHVTLPDDAPLDLVTANWGDSTSTQRGSALLLNLKTSLTLRNVSNKRVHGVTLLVLAQEVAAGGKASVSVPSLSVGPGEAFPVRIDLSLLRPGSTNNGPLVEVSLDGVIFEDLSFYGPNRLNCRRLMTTWEMEARRDRKFLAAVFQNGGHEAVRRYLVDVLAKLSDRPGVDVQMAKGRSTVSEPEQTLRFAFLRMPGEPVRPAGGTASVGVSEARSPVIDLQNVSNKAIRYLELGWMLSDQNGDWIYAGSLPAEVQLPPGHRTRIQQEAGLKLSTRSGDAPRITGVKGFVSQVEFTDGATWIPDRDALQSTGLSKVMNPSAEEQRLADLYRRKGINAVVDEIRKFQ